MQSHFSRRSFIAKAFATGAAAQLPWLGRMSSAKAATPINFVSVFVPDGCIPNLWYPKGSETGFTLPQMSEPLGAIKEHCIFFEGVGMPGGEPTHPGGTKKVLTGTGPQSMDVFLGQKLKGSAPFDSIQLGVASNFENGSGSVSFMAQGQEVKPDDNPLNAFARLFGKGTAAPTTPGMPPPGGIDPAELALKQKKSILDVIKGDITALNTKLAGAEKARLDSHLTFVRDVEMRLDRLSMPPMAGMTGGGGGAMCDGSGFNKDGYKNTSTNYPQSYHQAQNFPVIGKLQMDLLVSALGCGLTHSASLMWSHAVSPTKIPGVSAIGNHDASHYGVNAGGNTGQAYIANRRWFMSRFVELIQAMKALPYGDSNLLDHTVIFLCSDINDGDLHDHRQIPFVLAGGSKAGLKGGRFLSYAGKGQGGQNETHAKLLVSIARACGATEVNSFGYTAMGTGPLPGVV
jgi:Protein of unknown function (DUF1552)